jgi:hypothetical protein
MNCTLSKEDAETLNADAERIENEIEALMKEIKTLREKLTIPISNEQRETQWNEWSKGKFGGNPNCPIYHHSDFLKKMKEEFKVQKDRLSSVLQEGRRNRLTAPYVPSEQNDDYRKEDLLSKPSKFSGMMSSLKRQAQSLFGTKAKPLFRKGGKRKRYKTRRKGKK